MRVSPADPFPDRAETPVAVDSNLSLGRTTRTAMSARVASTTFETAFRMVPPGACIMAGVALTGAQSPQRHSIVVFNRNVLPRSNPIPIGPMLRPRHGSIYGRGVRPGCRSGRWGVPTSPTHSLDSCCIHAWLPCHDPFFLPLPPFPFSPPPRSSPGEPSCVGAGTDALMRGRAVCIPSRASRPRRSLPMVLGRRRSPSRATLQIRVLRLPRWSRSERRERRCRCA